METFYELPVLTKAPTLLTNRETALILKANRDQTSASNQTTSSRPIPLTNRHTRNQSTLPSSAYRPPDNNAMDIILPDNISDANDTNTPSGTLALTERPTPRLTNSLHNRFFTHSSLPRAFELERIQPFGKNNINQSYTSDKVFHHIVLIILKSKYLTNKEHDRVTRTCKAFKKLWHTWKCVRTYRPIDFRPLLSQPPNWESQTQINPYRVHLRLALLLHYDFDLAAVHRFIGGNHTAAHMDPERILSLVKDLLDENIYNDLERILRSGCPGYFNVHGTRANFLKYQEYGNHLSLQMNEERAKTLMVKEDKREFVLTFPSWVTDLIPNLLVNPQAIVIIPGKNDRLIFDSSFMIDADSRPYNVDCQLELEPEIFFGDAFIRHLKNIYCLRISFPNREIYLMDDDLTAAFRQIKLNPNIISAKAFIIGSFLHVCTGQNFGDKPSPANFEPVAQARMALASRLSVGDQPSP